MKIKSYVFPLVVFLSVAGFVLYVKPHLQPVSEGQATLASNGPSCKAVLAGRAAEHFDPLLFRVLKDRYQTEGLNQESFHNFYMRGPENTLALLEVAARDKNFPGTSFGEHLGELRNGELKRLEQVLSGLAKEDGFTVDKLNSTMVEMYKIFHMWGNPRLATFFKPTELIKWIRELPDEVIRGRVEQGLASKNIQEVFTEMGIIRDPTKLESLWKWVGVGRGFFKRALSIVAGVTAVSKGVIPPHVTDFGLFSQKIDVDKAEAMIAKDGFDKGMENICALYHCKVRNKLAIDYLRKAYNVAAIVAMVGYVGWTWFSLNEVHEVKEDKDKKAGPDDEIHKTVIALSENRAKLEQLEHDAALQDALFSNVLKTTGENP